MDDWLQHVFPPGPMLHISNIADGEAVSTEIQNALRQHGTLVSFRYFEQVRCTRHAACRAPSCSPPPNRTG